MIAEFTLKSVMAREREGYRFTFFCDLCDNSYTTGIISSSSAKEAEAAARREARHYFNLCHQCKKWICDSHYNEDVMMCVHCAPKQEVML